MFKKEFGESRIKERPNPTAGVASKGVVHRNVVGSGDFSVSNAGIQNPQLKSAFAGSSGSNLLGRTPSGFGYILQFERNNKAHLVFATRGTRPELGYPDLLTDANAGFLRTMPYTGPVHSGFYDSYEALEGTLNGVLDIATRVDVAHCVGHSLGGALANLVAIHFAVNGCNTKLYTFGAPRVGLSTAKYDSRLKNILVRSIQCSYGNSAFIKKPSQCDTFV